MSKPSFQTHLALFAAAITGVILFSLAGFTWWLLRRQYVSAVDARLLGNIERVQSIATRRPDIPAITNIWNDRWRDDTKELRVLIIQTRDGETLGTVGNHEWLEGMDLTVWQTPDEWFRDKGPPRTYPGPERKGEPEGQRERRGPPSPDRPRGPFGPDRELGEGEARRRPLPPEGTTRGGGLPPFQQRIAPPPGPAEFFSLMGPDGKPWRFVARGSLSTTLYSGVSLAVYADEIRPAARAMLLTIPLGLFFAAAGGWVVARRALTPMQQVSEMASQVTATGLDARIEESGGGYREFSDLIEVVNSMMNRLEVSFHQAARFSADASHELKTPISLMQAEIETALRHCEPGSEAEEALLHVGAEVQRLKRITQSLLMLSRADAGHVKLLLEPVNLSESLQALCEDGEVLCEEAGLDLKVEIDAPSIIVAADETLLLQAAQNLLQNAVKYNEEGGHVICRLFRDDEDSVCLDFSNTGPGIPEEDRERVFDRFYRVDRARNRKIDGFGLGLNLALEICRMHGGSLLLQEATEEITTFRMRLPAVTPGSSSE